MSLHLSLHLSLHPSLHSKKQENDHVIGTIKWSFVPTPNECYPISPQPPNERYPISPHEHKQRPSEASKHASTATFTALPPSYRFRSDPAKIILLHHYTTAIRALYEHHPSLIRSPSPIIPNLYKIIRFDFPSHFPPILTTHCPSSSSPHRRLIPSMYISFCAL